MRRDLSQLEKKNADKFNNVNYLHGFRFGVLEGIDEGYEQAIKEVQEKLDDIISDHCAEYGVPCLEAYSDSCIELEDWLVEQLKEKK